MMLMESKLFYKVKVGRVPDEKRCIYDCLKKSKSKSRRNNR